MIRHHFTVDVEEYFQVSAFESTVRRADWDGFGLRAAPRVREILELLGRHDERGTFFVLGWMADRVPELVKEIHRAGHEIASHGWDHKRVTMQSPDEFRASVRRTKQKLEDLTGAVVRGFRAPSFSIVPGYEWALDVLIDEGHQYDSSLFPVRRPGGYGYPDAPRHQHRIQRPSGTIIEFPMTTLRRFGLNIPASGGAYFRIFPYGVIRAALKQCEQAGTPGMFYLHPWELDPAQPRMAVPWLARVRHYTGLERTVPRLKRLFDDFRFTSIADTLAVQ